MVKNRNLLEIVEYASIAGSIMGSVAAVAYQNILYAAAPVSLSLLLNLANRQSWQRIPRAGGGEIVELQRQLNAEMESLRRQLSVLPQGSVGMEQSLDYLSQTIAQMQSQMAVQSRELITLQNNLQNLASHRQPSLAPLQAQLEELNSRIINMSAGMLAEPVVADVNLEGQFEDLKAFVSSAIASVSQSQVSPQPLDLTADITPLSVELEKLYRQLIIIQESLAPLGECLPIFNQKQDIFKEELARMAEMFRSTSSQQLEILGSAFSQLQQEIRENLNVLTASETEVDLSGVEAALRNLSDETYTAIVVMQNRLAFLETLDINLVREDILNLRNQLVDLQNSVDSLADGISSPGFMPLEDRVLDTQPAVEERETQNKIILEPILELLKQAPIQDEKIEEETPQIPPPMLSKPVWHCTNILLGHTSAVTCLAINPAGKVLASGSCKEIKLWSLERGVEIDTLAVNSQAMAIADIAMSPDGVTLAIANADIELWNLRTQEQIRTLETSCWASSVAISPDGKILVSAGEDPVEETGSLQIWNLVKAELLHDFGPDVIYAVAISPNGEFVVSAGVRGVAVDEVEEGEKSGLILVRRLPGGEIVHSMTDEGGKVYSVAISGDSNFLVSGGDDGIVKLWDLRSGKLVRTFDEEGVPVHSVAISPDGEFIAAGSSDKSVKLWNLQTGELLETFVDHLEKVTRVAFSPDGKILVSGSSDMTIKVCRCA